MWDEFDLSAMMWTIPDTRMKAQRELHVPLVATAAACPPPSRTRSATPTVRAGSLIGYRGRNGRL